MRTGIDATLLIALFVLLAVVLPVLAVVASSRIRRLEIARRGAGTPPRPTPDSRLFALERKLAALESRMASLETQAGVQPSTEGSRRAPIPFPEPNPEEAATLEGQLLPASPESQPPVPAPTRADLESVVAGRWLVYFGIIALLFALAFFIKYSFDNHWVGPRGRVVVGVVVGSLLVLWTHRLLQRGYGYFSEGIATLGAAVLYFSLWAGWHSFSLLPWRAALGGSFLVTAAMLAIGLGRKSQRLLLAALVGGYLTPFVLHTSHDPLVGLFAYLIVLSGLALALERAKRWAWPPLLGLLSFEAIYWVWFLGFYHAQLLVPALIFATLLFLSFAVMPALRGIRQGCLTITDFLVTATNTAGYLTALFALFWPGHRWLLLTAYLALALGYRQILGTLPQPRIGQSRLTRRFYATLALVCLSLTLPARFDHGWLTIAWAALGAVVVWRGVRIESWLMRSFGGLLLAIVCVRLLFLPLPAPYLLWNTRFLAFACVVGCLSFVAAIGIRASERLEYPERKAVGVLLVTANAFALLALSLEVWDALGRAHTPGMENWPAQQMGLSVLWTLYAAGLALMGVVRKSALLRWLALALFAMVVSKVFVYDMASLERFYRILSFLVLGVLLLVVSYLYQRRSAQKWHRHGGEP